MQIRDYIAEDSPAAAARVLRIIIQKTNRLIDHPKLGRRGRVVGTRELVITETPYISVYRVEGEMIDILRVLHGARQWPEC